MSTSRKFGTKQGGGYFINGTIEAVWEKKKIVPNLDPFLWGIDLYGTLIARWAYGDTSSKYGWEIDHIIPVAKLGTDDLWNLQPLQWQNNRSKGDSIAVPFCVVNK